MKKIALVTGGNSGIGYATAKLLKKKEYEVLISGRNPQKTQEAGEELGVKTIIADMTDIESIKFLASHFLESGLDVLVNNAGIAQFVGIDDFTEELFAHFLNVHLRGPLLLVKSLVSGLRKRKGNIVFVSSIATKKGFAGGYLYAAAKGGIRAAVRNLAVELAPDIRVNTVSPGSVDTPLLRGLGVPVEEIASANPLKRIGAPEDIASVILTIAENPYVTGANWVVDGGETAV
ncbi:SDR family NAD(P)-dependent oxidoreductase [Desulfonema magnum]|uniref:Dehydrogenase domain-containing protein n=1 Tax=Desulfonema magnum TaxID=45655 RepID=A0A975GMY0_9BACT|nr:SDR family oxidoreductase [Desulfonema magnum]QTA87192.1 Dehydrogenase domain-containing protein [Desulfonema magnum]